MTSEAGERFSIDLMALITKHFPRAHKGIPEGGAPEQLGELCALLAQMLGIQLAFACLRVDGEDAHRIIFETFNMTVKSLNDTTDRAYQIGDFISAPPAGHG